jgi:CubicO group peptidase (beta-lactamase class C family)
VLGYGRPGITVAQLVTHTSGLAPDQTQAVMYLWLDRDVDGADLASRRALGREAQAGSAGTFFYNNENYAVLGQMIAAATGQTYEVACTQRVITPAGARSAGPSPRTGQTLPWGGWHMTLEDYARILDWGYGPEGSAVGPQAAIASLARVPGLTSDGKGVGYGLGMFQLAKGTGYDVWHFGSWCYPLRHNVGSYAVRQVDGWRVVAAYDACVKSDAMRALFRAVSRGLAP